MTLRAAACRARPRAATGDYRADSDASRTVRQRRQVMNAESIELSRVRLDGDDLVLVDGRCLHVTPVDNTVTCLWQSRAVLEVSPSGEDRVFSLEVTNRRTRETVHAMWYRRGGKPAEVVSRVPPNPA